MDESELDAGIADLDSKLAGIKDKAINLGLNQGEVDAAIADIEAKLDAIRSQNAGVGLNQGDLDAAIADIQAKLAALGAEHVEIHIGTTGAPEATAEMAGMAAVMKAIEDNSGPLVAAITGLTMAEKSTGDQSSDTASKLGDVESAVTSAGNAAHSARGWMGLLTKEVTLFGGALGDMHMVGVIPLWHILMDGILETAIGLTEATIALTAFGMAAAPAVEDIITHIKSVDDVVKSLGVDIPPVTGHLHDLGKALAPQILELYGGALNTLSGNGSTLAGIVEQIVHGFDDWIAKLDLFMDAQSHTDGLVSAGGEVLKQMADILDNLGIAFENLMKADPGTVHFLLDLIEGGSKLIEIFTEIPTPILYTVLALHSFLLWGGLVTTGISKLLLPVRALGVALGGIGKEASAVGQLGEEAGGLDRLKAVLSDISNGFGTFGSNVARVGANMGLLGEQTQAAVIPMGDLRTASEDALEESGGLLEKLGALASSPWTWAAVGAAAVGYLAYEIATAKTSTQQWIDTLNTNLSKGTWFTTLGANMQALGDVSQKLASQQTQLGQAVTASQDSVGGVTTKYSLMAVAGKEAVDGTDALRASVSELRSEFGTLTTAQQAQIGFLTTLGKSYGTTLPQSEGLASLAGVNLTQVMKEGSKAYEDAIQEVANLVTGYKKMSVSGGLLSNAVNAVTFATEQQNSKVTALTQGWTTFIGMVTGGENDFATFETQIQGLGQAASGMVSSLSITGGKVSASLKQASTAASSSYTSTAMSASSANSAVTSYTSSLLKGTKAADESTNYQQKLTTSLQDSGMSASQAQSAVDAYTNSVTQNGIGTDQQAGARAQLIKQLQDTKTVTKDAGSAAATTSAQIDGLSSADLQLKQTFIEAITDGDSLMNSLLEQASAAGLGAKGTAMLTQAGKDMVAQMLPMAQGSADATAQLYALAQQAGYQGPDAFQSLVRWVGNTKDAEQNLEQITGSLTIASANLATDVENLANAINANLNQAMSAAIVQAGGGQKAFDAFATAAMKSHDNIGAMKDSAQSLASELITTLGNTQQAHNEFDTFAIQLGLTKTAADKLWQSVVNLAEAESRIPAHVSSVIQITEQIEQAGGTAGGITGINNSALPKAAKGMLVQGGVKGQDSVLILAKPGEAVVPEELVPPIAPYLGAHRVPGFASGGIVGDTGPGYIQGGHSDPASAPAAGGGVHIEMKYYGTQDPTPEQQQAMILSLTRAVGVAG